MYKIKFIAPKYLISPLAILGIKTFPADSESEARSALEQATGNAEPALVFISERLAADLQPEIERLNARPGINIIMMPDNQGSIGLAARQIDNLIRNSIGAEVILRR
ncbi:MAG: V-type ATP synthase subunit F [Candidatus Margulisbacteria bacterium]|nr:V-type ATP synthase subunit F [Candidatus Margulisiibacteriota bacterium]